MILHRQALHDKFLNFLMHNIQTQAFSRQIHIITMK